MRSVWQTVRYFRMIFIATLKIDQTVFSNPIQPGPGIFQLAERFTIGKRFDEHILQQVVSCLRITDPPTEKTPEFMLVIIPGLMDALHCFNPTLPLRFCGIARSPIKRRFEIPQTHHCGQEEKSYDGYCMPNGFESPMLHL